LDTELQSAYREELQRLEQTAAEIDRQLQTLEAIPRYYGDDLTEQALENIREARRRNLRIASPEPYFGRLDFQEKGSEQIRPLYIGKIGVEDENTGELLVIDWRAPIASMFYSFTGADETASYDSPEGLIEGLIYLKRNLVIRKQILQRVVDAYVKGGDNLGVADEFLLYRLGENKDNKLRDIVSTIQEEQDRIIRSARNKALVIQGVAGSGKTTVALHRLAFLLYQYRENIRAEQMIIFAPNAMFLDYISSVLPELGVGGIQQTTFTDWALDLLGLEVDLTDSAQRLNRWFAIGPARPALHDDVPGRYKGSLRFRNYLSECLDRYEKGFVPNQPFEAWEGAVLPVETLQTWFHTEYQHYPLMKRRERIQARIKRWLEIELDKIGDPSRRKDLKKKASSRLRAFLKLWPEHTPYTFYKLLFSASKRPDSLPLELLERIPAEVVTHTMRNFKHKRVDPEDLAPLIYIHKRFYGLESRHTFDHTVIDEAQDFSPFQVALLKEQTRGNSFTILGDLSQGIHAYQGIRDWEEFLDLFEPDERAFFRLERSYRSTMEIIHFANEVISKVSEPMTLAKPVFRSGEPVRVLKTTREERLDAITDTLRDIRATEVNTIAVITRTEEEAIALHARLIERGLTPNLITSGQRVYQGGLSIVPAPLCKGLEFDAVLLVDVDAAHYEQNDQDAKLLYVGCTRALHVLRLLYAGEPSPLLP
jgi:DNA helicase-2/ATP-dependent DNA helicase PcrA